MGRAYDYVKRQIVDFRLDMCCWVAPVKVGLLITGYLNIILAMISILGLSDDSFAPVLAQVQDAILGDNAKKPLPILAYSAELTANVILLAALYRKDIPLLRFYQRYCIAAVITSVLVYSMVIAAIGIITGFILVMSIVLQLYVLILVRSMIVEMKLEKKNIELPTLVMSSLIHEAAVKEVKIDSDVEAPSDSDNDDEKVEKKAKLETVNEHPKEESSDEEVKEKK
ncbi:uncharacterized protein LOC142977287 [Anticarsia gemmatalis]|uniref:uncharacterized protein LOC142977287 n=1 Tax=Anticarsia gemmatalis TaxID=129554 RepID=UPI003F75A9C7